MSDTNKSEFDYCECGAHVISCVPSWSHPYCTLCVWLPGWWRDPAMRDQLAHGEQWRRELALRAAAEEWEMNGR